jgi:hypothetical protein
MSKLKLQVWDRQPTETSKAWAAFLIFRDSPPNERTLQKTAEKLSKNLTTIKNWSAANNWFERAREFDAWLDREATQSKHLEAQRAKTEMVERHTAVTTFAQSKVVERWRRMTNADWDKLNPVQATDIFIRMAQFERLSRGLPSSSVEIRTPEQIKAQQITEAKLYLDEIRHDFPRLTLKEHLQIVCSEFEVTPEEIGYGDFDALEAVEVSDESDDGDAS